MKKAFSELLIKQTRALSGFAELRTAHIHSFFKYNSAKKLRNLLLLMLELKLRRTVLRAHPILLAIDPINACDLRCPLCPKGREELGRPVRRLEFHEFKRIIDELGDYLYEVSFFIWGEPLLNKEISQMVKYAHDQRIMTCISANLNTLSSEGAKALVESRLDYLTISTSGLTQEIYSRYHVEGDLGKVVENIKHIIRWKQELSTSSPFIEWKHLIFRHNLHEVDRVERFAEAIGVDGVSLVNADGPPEWVLTREERGKYPSVEYEEYGEGKACNFLWYYFIINPDGGVSPCCLPIAYEKRHDFGNIFDEDLSSQEIWNNPKFVAARFIFREVELSIKDIICNTCQIAKDFIRLKRQINPPAVS